MLSQTRSGPRRLIATAALGLLLLLSGCSQTAVVLWTNVPEIVPAVELFNASQDEHIVEIVYEPDLGSALRLAETPPDLVLGAYIEDQATARLFTSLDGLLRRDIDEDAFYADLLATGVRGGRHHLLPVSFNLPLVFFREETEVGVPIIITPAEMQERSVAALETEDDDIVRLGYSPIWNEAFLYQFLRLGGLGPQEAADGDPTWSFEAMLAGVRAAREWVELQGGIQADRAFQDTYLYDPAVQLVRQGRTVFGYDGSDTFLSMSDARRLNLDFRWLGSEDTVHALERVVYAGIPVGATSRTGAERFLAELFSVDHQANVVRSGLRKRVSSFGFAGGFSSLWRVNEHHLPEIYPELNGKIPAARRLAFPPASPRHWGELVDEVVQPWLLREVIGTPQTRDLEASVRAWLLQQED